MRRGARWGFAAVVLAGGAGVARAHEVGGSRFDAPVPLPLVLAGAGLTVAVTAGWLALGGEYRERERRVGRVPTAVVESARVAARYGFLAAVVAAIAAGLVGPRTPAENPATLFVWPVWLKGVGLVAAAVGSPWRVLSPWRTVYGGLLRLEGRGIAVLGAYPERLSEWPALAGFLVWFGVVENLTVAPRSPRFTAVVVAGYAAVMVAGGVAFGPTWFDRADALAVLYRLFGRVSPVRIDHDDSGAVVSVRPPWQGPTEPASVAVGWFAVAAVYTASFDGFTSTPEYRTLAIAVRDLVGPAAGVALYLVGVAAFVAAFALIAAVAGRGGWRSAVRAFAPTVLPIAVAYEVAHNYPFVLGSLGRLSAVLLGTDAAAEPLAWLSLPAFWASQVVLVVGGHVVAVAASHGVAAGRSSVGSPLRSHGVLTLLMVGYTVLSLWIVSRPVVT